MIPVSFLNVLHQAQYVYVNDNLNELYVWYGDNVIKIFNFLGKEIGKSNIINYQENKIYKEYEPINIRDVSLSIDDIVYSSYKNGQE
jgi:hypothetical protein